MWRVAAAVGLACVARCGADMPAVDIYRVQWDALKGAAAALGGDSGAFAAAVEGGAQKDAVDAGPGVLVFRSPFGFTGPFNERLRSAFAAGRKAEAEAFLRAVNEGGWIKGQLIAREGGDYTVSVACHGEAGGNFVVEYTHRFADGRKATHSHHVTAEAKTVAPGEFSWLAGAEDIVIEDHWIGYGPASPAMADYTLRREGGDFVGKAAFSAGGHFRPKAKKDSCEVRVPGAAAAAFLKALAGCASREGEYKPAIDHTDDYPKVRITLSAGERAVVFRSESQGEFHAPWAVEQDGKTRVVDADAPGRALKALEPHLAKERFRALTKEVEGGGKGGDDL